jgi:hypothetical protein
MYFQLNRAAADVLERLGPGGRDAHSSGLNQLSYYLNTDAKDWVEKVIRRYGLASQVRRLCSRAASGDVRVSPIDAKTVEVSVGGMAARVEVKPLDYYLAKFLGLDARAKLFPLLKVYFSCSPRLEFFMINDGLSEIEASLRRAKP